VPFSSARLTGWAAERWPQLAGVPWYVPWSDAWCGNVGLGRTAGRGAALQVGTSGAMRIVLGEAVPPVPAGLFAHRLPDGTALVGGQLSEGGGTVAAIARLLGSTPARLEAAARDLPPDRHGLSVLPFLAGERGPGYRADARGTIDGLGLGTSGPELHLAVLEAIAFRFASLDARLGAAAEEPIDVMASGGALAKSPLWTAIVAAALGRTISHSTEGEASSRGAALLALSAAGVIGAPADVPPPPSVAIVPDPDRAEAYRRARVRQEALYARLLGGRAPGRGAILAPVEEPT
jgi:gluconokinase